MGLAYSGGTVQKVALDGSSAANLATDLVASMVAAGWTSSVISGGHSLLSATTSQGLACVIEVVVSGSNCNIRAKTTDGAVSLTQYTISTGVGVTYYIITNRYSIWILRPSSTMGVGAAITAYQAGVPFLPDPVEPLSVLSATNATPIVVTTTTTHGLSSGDFVFIDGVTGNTAANGHFSITVVSPTSFSLDGSVGSGAYVSGGLVGTDDRVSRCIYSIGNNNGVFSSSWRFSPLGAGFGTMQVLINEVNFSGNSDQIQLLASSAAPWRATRYSITEPYVYVPLINGGTKYVQFQLWNAALVSGTPQIAMDSTMTFDGHSWQVYGSNANCALVVAYT